MCVIRSPEPIEMSSIIQVTSKQKKSLDIISRLLINGTEGGTRTPTELPPTDFESVASANFATLAMPF